MQTAPLIAFGLVSGTALIAGTIRFALHPPAFFKKPLMAEALDRLDQSDGNVTVFAGSNGSSGGGSDC